MQRWAVPSRSGALLAVIMTAVAIPRVVDVDIDVAIDVAVTVAVDVAKSGAMSVPDSM